MDRSQQFYKYQEEEEEEEDDDDQNEEARKPAKTRKGKGKKGRGRGGKGRGAKGRGAKGRGKGCGAGRGAKGGKGRGRGKQGVGQGRASKRASGSAGNEEGDAAVIVTPERKRPAAEDLDQLSGPKVACDKKLADEQLSTPTEAESTEAPKPHPRTSSKAKARSKTSLKKNSPKAKASAKAKTIPKAKASRESKGNPKANASAKAKASPKKPKAAAKPKSKSKGKAKQHRKDDGSEPREKSFARRWRPEGQRASEEWQALRDVFDAHVRPHLPKSSAAEDPVLSLHVLQSCSMCVRGQTVCYAMCASPQDPWWKAVKPSFKNISGIVELMDAARAKVPDFLQSLQS